MYQKEWNMMQDFPNKRSVQQCAQNIWSAFHGAWNIDFLETIDHFVVIKLKAIIDED